MTRPQWHNQIKYEQANCEYCHASENGNKNLVKRDKNLVYVTSDVLVIRTEDTLISVQINNCPMCGRDLTRGTREV